ncbi:replication initiator protein [Apis mellifera associated microvirus 18]|nr:replication initiator protein [Apis mellifera associated microvirus 18]
MHELQTHERASFLTLTYDDDHVPKDGSLNVKHFQDFMKRLRRGCSSPLRFFHCGEYGEENARPHYHCILFGEDFMSDRVPYKKTPLGHQIYVSPRLSEVWGNGALEQQHIGDVTFESAAYVARYCLKKITGPSAQEHYQGRKPEYVTMSRRPGIGAHWYSRFSKEVYPSDSVVLRRKNSCIEMRPPDFYDKLLEKADPKLFAQIKRERSVAATEAANHPDQRSRRLLDREAVKKATIDQTLKRS